MIAFFEQISKPGMKQVSCSVKTYLFSIGKYKIINFSRRKGRTISMVNEDLDLQLVEWEESRADLSDEQMRILGLLDHIGSKCKELLVLFYYHGFRLEAIKREMNYASENAVKVTKSNCMKKLRSLVTKKQS